MARLAGSLRTCGVVPHSSMMSDRQPTLEKSYLKVRRVLPFVS